jgi:hypothetical protein
MKHEPELTRSVRWIAAGRPGVTLDSFGPRPPHHDSRNAAGTNPPATGHGRSDPDPIGQTAVVASTSSAGISHGRRAGEIFRVALESRSMKAAAIAAFALGFLSVLSHRQSIPDRPMWTNLVYQVWW